MRCFYIGKTDCAVDTKSSLQYAFSTSPSKGLMRNGLQAENYLNLISMASNFISIRCVCNEKFT